MLLFNIYGECQWHKIMPRIISCQGMDVSSDDPDLAQTVLTCEGDLRDPAFPNRLTQIICKLKRLVSDDKKPFQVTKVEPWNSVRVTFNIPRNAAQRLRQLAERGDNTLRELGILSVQIEGDQVITLTLTNNFGESGQQLVIGKSSDSVVNNTSAISAVNSSALNIINSELIVNYNNVNNLTASSVSSLVSSGIDLIGTSSSGSSVEITRKNIAQYLSQQHIDVVNSTANPNNPIPNSVDVISDRLPAFRSPNVVAPINTEPIPFLNSSSTTTVTSQLSTCVSSTASTCTVSSSAGNRLSAVTSIANSSLREIQSNYGLFPFASMQHSYQAMHTSARHGLNASHYTSVQRPNQVIATPSVRLPSTLVSQSRISAGITSTVATVSSTIASVSRPQPTATNVLSRVSQSLSSQSPISAPLQTSQSLPQAAQTVNSASANVALTSPLLVNLLQSDATSGHLKGPTAQTSALNQINDLMPKRKPRKTRKSKEKSETEGTQSSYFVNTSAVVTQTIPQSSAQTSVTTTSSTSSSLKHLPSNPLPQKSALDSQQMQSTFNISPHLISIPISAMSRFPSIHPEAQGQPQVVRAGQLPLRSQIPAPTVGAPPISTTHLRKPLFVTTSQGSCSKPVPILNKHSILLEEQKSSPNPNPNSKAVSSGTERNSETNAVFPSPPTSRMTGKTKHLINPFTGLLEPMLSDEEEEDRPSPATLFPELDAGSDVGGNSERSVSDAGSNGKETNLSSDTDSGLGKSGTDVSSQSSIDVGNCDNTLNHLKASVSAIESMSSNESSTERLKLKVKLEVKTECPKVDNSSSNPLFQSRSHLMKQKSSEPLNPLSTICGTTQPTDANPVVMAEPRVPPLHISIRGPNSAVVVSNRRESTSDIEMKTIALKKVRAVRTTRAVSVESGLGSSLGTECTNNLNKNQRKKLQREQRFLSGGGIVTSNSSLCASPPSAESLIDINKTVNDLSFELSSGPTTHTSESVDTLLPQLDSSFAQNKSIDNNDNKNNINNSKNISTKCVPLISADDNSSQKCAIPETTIPSTKASVLSSDETVVDKTNSDSLSLTNSFCVGLTSNMSDNNSSNQDNCDSCYTEKTSSPNHQKVQICSNINNETSIPESIPVQTVVSSPPNDNHKDVSNESEKCLEIEKVITKSRKLPVAAVVTVEPLITTNTESFVNKISRIGRINCISSSIPALVNTRELNNLRNTSALHSTQTTSPSNSLYESPIEDECNETVESNQTNSSILQINANVSQTVVTSESEKPIDISNKTESQTKSDVVMNGDINRVMIESPTNLSETNKTNPNIESESKPKSIDQEMNDSNEGQISHLVNTEEKVNQLEVKSECQSNQTNNILSEVQTKESNDNDSESVCKANQMPINSCDSNTQTVSQITANSDGLVKTEPKSSENKDSVDSNTKDSVSKQNVSDVSENEVKKCDKSADIVSNSGSDGKNLVNDSTKNSERLLVKSAVVDDKAKQPLQIVISTTVPSLTTTTSTAMFPHLKSSTLESGSRVTLITFKPNLNSPNSSSNLSGKTSHFSNALSSQMPSKAVPFKLLTIPSGSGGITVRSAANKLVELINSTASSPVSPLSPNQMSSSGSPIPINTTSPPVRLLVSKVSTTGSVTQTGVPVSAAGNSIGQLVVVKSVVVTNPSPSIKLVPAKNPSVNSSSLLIPVTTNSSIDSLNAFNSNNNNIEQKPKQLSHSLNNQLNNISANDHNSDSDSDVQNQDSNSDENNCSQQEPVDLSVQCSESQSMTSSDDTKVEDNDTESVPRLIKSSLTSDNEILSDEEVNDDNDNALTHSVASDHNYILRKSNNEFEEQETEESVLNLSNTSDNYNSDALRDNDISTEDEYRTSGLQNERTDQQSNQSHDLQSRPNKRKSSENAAELIKACMGVDDNPKKNSTFNCTTPFNVLSGVSARTPNMSTRTRTSSLDNDCVINSTISESSETNHLNKTSKNLRLRKSKVSSSEPAFTADNCSSDEEIAIKDNAGLSWGNRPRLRTGSAQKNQKINKQKNMNCIKDTNNDKMANRLNERPKKGRDRDQSRTSSTQRSTRRSRDHNIMITTTGINLHSSESSSESLHMEIVGLELSNDSNTNNYNNDASTASTTPPIITSSLLVKRKTRIGLNNNNNNNNNTEQTDTSLTKRRRIVKENHR